MSEIRSDARHLLYVDYLGLCDLTTWTPMPEHRWDGLTDDEVASELSGLRDILKKLVNRELYINWWTSGVDDAPAT